MAISKQRLTITNDGPMAITLHVEPWGRDYTILWKETLDLVMESVSSKSYFHLVSEPPLLTVNAEGDAIDVVVYQSGNVLEVGHNRDRSEVSWLRDLCGGTDCEE